MSATAVLQRVRGPAFARGRRRVWFTFRVVAVIGLIIGLGWQGGLFAGWIRAVALGMAGLAAFSLFEQWPARLPSWIARWALQVVMVAVSMPLATYWIYVGSTDAGAPAFWDDPQRFSGFWMFTVMGMLIAPWVALTALFRQKDAFAREQALAFALERSQLERQSLDARLHLLQAQVAPHFLFNTLANVQALVDAGSPRAAEVLRSLVAYLRAAVPRLQDPATTLGQELELVKAYLDLMHMRMPDRLQFSVKADPSALGVGCPPLTLLTLVENAVKHGIDPSEEGGRIDIEVRRSGDRCRVRVIDTGVGLSATVGGLGTGLTTLRERLRLAFGDEAALLVGAPQGGGLCAELELPVREASP